MKERSLPFGSGLSAKAKGKRPVGRESEELLDANKSLPHIPTIQPTRQYGFARASTYAHPERKDVDTGSQSEKGEEGSRTRTRGTVAAPAIDASKNSDEQDNMILVMGSTGAGKSRFINKLAQGNEAKEGHSLRSGLRNLHERWTKVARLTRPRNKRMPSRYNSHRSKCGHSR